MSNKRKLDRSGLEQLLRVAGLDPAQVRSYDELTEGTFNTVYRIGLPDGDLMLKLAPDPAAPVLSYEHGLIRTETEFYAAAQGKAPVPEVVHAGADFLLMTAIPGATWHSQTITGDERARLRKDLGRIVAGLHDVTGTAFGYPQKPMTSTWGAAFLAMMDELLADATTYDVKLPRPPEAIRQLVLDRLPLLDAISTPTLVHFDLWDGNILVDNGQITGLIDGERAFWGDPAAEFVSLSLFENTVDPDLLAGYGPLDQMLLPLYRVYLYLIMTIEVVPRGYKGPEHEQLGRLVNRHLLNELGKL